MFTIAIFSLELDIHAYAIMDNLRKVHGVKCHFVATNATVTHGGIIWRNDCDNKALLRSYEGEWFNVEELDLIWWRRVNQPQLETDRVNDDISKEIVTNEWKSSLLGIILDKFKGVWVNKPHTDLYGGNKLYHLNVAKDVGFRVPKTLISQDFNAVIEFCDKLGGEVIVKKLLGTSLRPLVTLKLSSTDLRAAEEAILLCPAMYQEVIDGNTHLRVNCFGRNIHPILIEANRLDWRRDLSVPFKEYRLEDEWERKLYQILCKLDLRMGIMDLKYNSDGDLVWLEINTQGQFLFGEALTGYDLTNSFSQFLIQSIEEHRVTQKAGCGVV
ncbi:RimK family alpha-L-glutamate ligase [Lewinella sp. IMCC34183]|uniref:ATP-grasp domain-containing protein n=1 Tax=Lewinella sp. IMCC34183 TaxID=2248762 RepID=UPI000E285F99|nr:hypothetical protein [Lewinella sp. IMCC34183]